MSSSGPDWLALIPAALPICNYNPSLRRAGKCKKANSKRHNSSEGFFWRTSQRVVMSKLVGRGCHIHITAFCQPSEGTPHLPSPLPRASLITCCLGLSLTLGLISSTNGGGNPLSSSIKGYNVNVDPTYRIHQSL